MTNIVLKKKLQNRMKHKFYGFTAIYIHNTVLLHQRVVLFRQKFKNKKIFLHAKETEKKRINFTYGN